MSDTAFVGPYFCNPLDDSVPVIAKNVCVVQPKDFRIHDWHRKQMADPAIGCILKLIKEKQIFQYKVLKEDSKELQLFLKTRNNLVIRNGLHYQKVKNPEGEQSNLQFVLPKAYRFHALKSCHDDVGHLGRERTVDLIRDRFYWPSMAKDVECHIATCDQCLKFKSRAQRAEQESIRVTHPLELIHIDFLSIESEVDSTKVKNVLAVTDHVTHYAQAYVTALQTASVVARVLWDNFICHYGIPEKILSNQGGSFCADLILELLRVSGLKKLRTTPYHPQTNSQCERFNSTLINMIGTLPLEAKSQWPQHIPTLVHAYNCTRSNATGYSPYYLLNLQKPLLPIEHETCEYCHLCPKTCS